MAIVDEAFEALVESGCEEGAVDLVLAAMAGAEQLETVLDGGAAVRTQVAAPEPEVSPPSVYLSDITVSGFRGVGPESTIGFTPGPGLTVVVGRNGSGKSSFSDALEVALTGESFRWKGKPAEWKNGWRNLHNPDDARVVARFQSEGLPGPTTVECTWPDGSTKVEDATTWAQHHGQTRTDLDGLGWSTPLALYRPLLSYSELGLVASSPSSLFDALSGVLGLEEMTSAAETIRQARLTRERLDREAKDTLKDRILPALENLDDQRARDCCDALSGRSWDLDRVGAIVTGGGPAPNPELGVLANLDLPEPDRVRDVVTTLRHSASALEEVEATDSAQARRLVDLLAAALDHHDRHDQTPCPVCGTGTLDTTWADRTRSQVAALTEQARRFDHATAAVTQALDEARNLIRPPSIPTVDGVDTTRLAALTSDLAALPDTPAEAADHIESRHLDLWAEAERVRSQAAQAFSAAEEAWRPLATEVAQWVEGARAAVVARDQVAILKKAEAAAKDAGAVLRSKRFEPIASKAVELWESLRLQSNVELTSVGLSGDGTRRRVDLDVRVDGTDGAALGVVSQGEVNCLALSLFFPRATLPGSPFRFLVIDDPVQAMDPARVDGLARVFAQIATDRQVIVFTHDDRLPESLRRLGLAHTSKEVTRRPGSVVAVRDTIDPVNQYFKDAWAVAMDEQLADGVAERVVPGICRLGIEAAFTERARRDLLARGETHVATEDAIGQASTLTQIAALALFGNASEGGRVLPHLDGVDRQFANVFRDCNEGSHRGFRGPLKELVNTARALAGRVRQ